MDQSPDESSSATTPRYYTPGMLAGLLDVPVASIRSWLRRGLIHPVETINRVPYFDFSQLAAGRQLVQLLGQGMTPSALQHTLRRLSRWLPHQSLAELSLRVDGNEVLLSHEGQILESGGQKRIDFDDPESSGEQLDESFPDIIPMQLFATELAESASELPDLDNGFRLKRLAELLEDAGEIDEAIEAWRTFHLACGPRADSCFRLGELLYLTGDYPGARERYYMALEMDPNLVEVRASLGCVLVELGEFELAISALRGALEYSAEYPDVYYHLAGALESAGRADEAVEHWTTFLRLSPAGPWAEQARGQLAARVPQPTRS